MKKKSFILIGFIHSRDRFRTTINVWGDCIGAGIVDHLSKKEIEKMNLKEEIQNANENEIKGYGTISNNDVSSF